MAIAGSTVAWPLRARAQQAAMPVVGYLSVGEAPAGDDFRRHLADMFRRGLSDIGYVEGRNVAIEFLYADGQYDRLTALAADLVRRQVSVIVASSPVDTALAAKAATATIPIVFGNGSDPVRFGLVASLNRPGGNITGITFLSTDLETKRLGLLRELVPQAAVIAVLVNPANANAENQSKELKEAARTLGLQLHFANARSEGDFDAAFATMVQMRVGALLVAGDPLFFFRRKQLVALAARHSIPALYDFRQYPEAGGLASYGTHLADAFHHVGIYAGRILKGEKPAELPVMQSTRFEFVINLKTAEALGLEVPPTLLARADEIIE
jgi:putative tryptophan/tyrosine transport system substrate-binding protein